MHRSGAMISLDYFSSRPAPTNVLAESGEPDAKRHRVSDDREWTSEYSRLFRDAAEAKRLLHIFRFIEDADLWNWWLEGSKDFSIGFGSLRLDMNPNTNPKLFDSLRSLRADVVMKIGAAEREITDQAISEELKRTFELEIAPAGGIRCLGVVTERGDLRSELGNRIALQAKSLGLRGFGCVMYHVPGLPDGKIKLSVRGVDGEDSLEITECFGGGGHKGASSCNIDLSALSSWRTSTTSDAPEVADRGSKELKNRNASRNCDKHGVSFVLAFGCPCCGA